MDLTDRNELKGLLSRHGITLAKTYGQHFLVDRKALTRIVEAAFPSTADRLPSTVFEVGPGVGTLTCELATRAGRVVAIERDPRFLPVLKETLSPYRNIDIINADALDISFSTLASRTIDDGRPTTDEYAVVSNLPYEISSPFLWKLLVEEARPPERITLLLQEEVVDRIVAKPPEMNMLSLLVALYGTARKVARVPPSSFLPSPRVRSAVVTIDANPHMPTPTCQEVLRLAKRAFAAPRKKLKTTIGTAAGAYVDRRPAELAVTDWVTLMAGK